MVRNLTITLIRTLPFKMSHSIPHLSTLVEYFYHWKNTQPDAIFLRQPYGRTWKTLTYKEAYDEATKMVTAIEGMGIEKGSHIAIFSKNCYHWILADMAIMMAGCVSVPLYANLSAKQFGEVIKVSDTKLIFVGKLEAWDNHPSQLDDSVQVVRFPHYEGNVEVEEGVLWNDLIAQSKPSMANFVPSPEDLWTILFTSGTTGTPKGVMHKHKTPIKIVHDDMETLTIGASQLKARVFFSYLPLNHVGEKIGVHVNALTVGGSISFGESLDTFIYNLQDTQPGSFFSVPRIWTKFYQGVTEKLPLKQQRILFNTPIVGKILKAKIRKSLGLGRAEIVATGSAITPAYLKKWYKQLGIHLIEAYGMTELCGAICYGSDLDTPLDSVGKILKGTTLKIDPDTQEILLNSPYAMVGYYKEPELTNKVLENGWYHTGDIGEVDTDGYLRITGRMSDTFKTSKGKYVSPNKIEEVLGEHFCIEQVCVAGLGIPQPIALVNLNEVGSSKSSAELEKSLAEAIGQLNADLANYERVSTIIVDRTVWSTENEILTPTLKVRRTSINKKYSANFEGWHEDEKKIIWI